jgi:hypothetical protein
MPTDKTFSSVHQPVQPESDPRSKSQPDLDEEQLRPYVIVDVLFEDGLLFLAVQNIGARPAFEVKVRWEPSFRGLGGSQLTSDLPLFKALTFLAPGRCIRTLLDDSQAYFQRDEPTQLAAFISYKDDQRRSYRQTIQHNLEIYRDLVYPLP